MSDKYFQALLSGAMTILIIGSIFVSVPVGHAQSLQEWSDPVNLSNAGSSTNPAMVIDAMGTIHAIWFDVFDGYKYTKSIDGVNWTPPETANFPFSPALSVSSENILQPEAPVLLADGNGGIHALWRDKNDALYYSTVFLSADLDLTSNWTGRIKLADAVLDFDVVLSSQGILHVGYVSKLGVDDQPPGVYYRQLKGASWSTPSNLYSSQYFRSIKPENTNIHLAVSETIELEAVYVVWDDYPQRQALLSKSIDGGNLWENATQIGNLEDSSGTPYNINVGAVDGKILLLWQSGSLGSQCALYSQWSTDNAEHFRPPEKVLDESVGCSQDSEFVTVNNDYMVVSLNILDDTLLLAWNGSRWSRAETQSEITTFINPLTQDSVVLGCKYTSYYNGNLFVVGCDKGTNGDIWFSTRSLDAINDWFPSSSVWTVPIEAVDSDQRISELSLVSDGENNTHMFWIQAPVPNESSEGLAIHYAGWNGQSWSQPAIIISGLDGRPIQLMVNADSQGRLMLTWVDSKTGGVLFSWADSSRASIAAEWEIPQYIPSVSQVNSSPDILADDSGKIVIAYAVPINEERGIYFVESDDGGKTWNQSVQVFDAVSAGWDIVDHPDVSLTGDGSLHVLFNRYSSQGEPRQSLGLYYSQSANGGITWSDAEVVSEQLVPWSKIVSYDKLILHRLWQEYRQSMLVSFHQFSQDGGVTWSRPLIVSSIDTNTSLTAQTIDKTGNLYFLQLAGKDNQTILSDVWNGSNWSDQDPKGLYIKNNGIPSFVTASVSPTGDLVAAVLADYPFLNDEYKNSIFSISKSLGLPEEIPAPYPAIISIAEPMMSVTEELPNVLQSPTPVSSVTNLNDLPSSAPGNKNIVGFLLLGGVIVLIVVIFRPIIWKKNTQEKKPD